MSNNYDFTPEQKRLIVGLLWNSLKKDPEHKDRRQTGYGTKTQTGLFACIESIIQNGPGWHPAESKE